MTLTKEQKLDAYHLMWLIRRFEEKCAELYAAGDIGGFLHLYIGQEAIAAAARYALRPDDNLITAYRDHGLALARDLPANAIMADMMGRTTGVSKGKGGSMHLADINKRFWGGYAVVGGHLPLATGFALADQYKGNDRITMCLMGDGATNIGYFHESLNLAGVWDLPVIWVVENNEYGMGTAVARASAQVDFVKRAIGYDMPAKVADGNDLDLTYEVIQEAAEYVRSGKGPYLLELRTYRFRGHSMGDPERYRKPEEIEERRARDPIELLEAELVQEFGVTEAELEKLSTAANQEVEEAVKFAHESPLPTEEDLYADVYA
jgi:pyruvate dehydrogenase E1 component alpha subunit